MMNEELTVIFDNLEDPRLERHKLYPLGEILFLVLAAVTARALSWRGVETYGEERLFLLRNFMPFEHGIPSHQTIGRVFSLVKPKVFEVAFIQFMCFMTKKPPEQIVALDGKTLRGSFDKAKGQTPLHILNACAVDNGLALGQAIVDSKTNEITVVPELLKMLDLHGATITTDALNTQKNIAEQIVKSENNYVLPVKDNHKELREEVEEKFSFTPVNRINKQAVKETVDKEHGRIDERFYHVLQVNLEELKKCSEWPGIKSIGMTTTQSTRGEKTSIETRYYIMSFLPDVERFAAAVRGHWRVENSLHWTLDVTFREDESRVRKDHAPANFSLVRKLAMNILRAEKSIKKSIPQKMIKAALNPEYQEFLLRSAGF
jgi:predicted transposase YbfD/YdcC